MIRVFITTAVLFILSAPAMGSEPRKSETHVTVEVPAAVCSVPGAERCFNYKAPADSNIGFRKIELGEVIDGSSFVANGQVVTLWGIVGQKKGNPMYERAKLLLETFTKKQTVYCREVAEITATTTPYVRCLVEKADLGALMVRVGLALDDWNSSAGYYAYDEAYAKKKKFGLWKLVNK